MKYINGLISLSVLFCFSSQADIVAPFEIDYSKFKYDDSIQLYVDVRAIYGEGIESNDSGRLRGSNEQLKLGVRYKHFFNHEFFLKADIRGVYLHSLEKDDNSSEKISDARLEVREFFFQKQDVFNDVPIAFLVGRKQFRDERAWWYSNQLDVVQVQYFTTLLKADISYGGRLFDERVITESENIGFEDSEFLIAHLDYHFYYQHHFQTFMVYQNDDFSNNQIGNVLNVNSTLNPELNLLWLGFRFNGLFSLVDKSKLRYWLDVSTVNGSEREFVTSSISSTQTEIASIRDIDVSAGYAFDFGGAWKTADDNWGFAANYAFGSGDSSADNKQSSYRQPGIASNKGSAFGGQRYRIYGELLRPELSNLQLLSFSASRKINPSLWLQVTYFHYRQVQADKELRTSNLIISPNGESKNIGGEIDVMLVSSWSKNIAAQFILSGFHSGSAFNDRVGSGSAYKGVFQLRLNW
jgi:hypothetical protein